MDRIILDGGKINITKQADTLYRVDKGQVFVYIAPVRRDGERETLGRRMFVSEAAEGDFLPSLCHESEMLGSWRFVFVALEHAELSAAEGADRDRVILDFAKRIELRLLSSADFEEEMIERYNLASIKDEGYIYVTQQEDKNTLKRSASLILNIFREPAGRAGNFLPSGNPLYDAVACICGRERIPLAPYDRMMQACGTRMTLHDISRISHFTVREVVLSGAWYKKDSGALLAITKDGHVPVPCIPTGVGHYSYVDPQTGERKKIDRAFAETLEGVGYAFYRPFPQKKLTKTDLLLFGFQKVFRSDILRVLLLTLLGTAVGLLIPYLNEQVFDRYIPLGDGTGLAVLGGMLLACALGNISFTVVRNLASFRSMKTMEYAVQNAALDRLFNLPESFFRDHDAAKLGESVMGISLIYQTLAANMIQVALTALFSILYLTRMFAYSPALSRTAILLLAAITFLLMILCIRQTNLEKEKMRHDLDANSLMFQFISGIEKIRISASENRAVLKYLTFFARSQETNARKERITNLVNVVAVAAPALFSLVFFRMMVTQEIPLSIGAFSGFLAAFGALQAAVFSVIQSFLLVNMIKPIYDEARPILETLPELSEETKLPEELEGDVEVSHVTFSYSDAELPVLNDINLHILPGEYVAIVGPSGCGKSTLLKLLLGFEKPRTGKIYYDSSDIDEMDKRELRKKFGVVLQDGGLIAGSIYDNITITAPDIGMERVQEVIEEVGLKEDIEQMPMGLHTIVSEAAGTISGGQKQRIMIARALVGKPKLILLDEATSALDNTTQSMVMDTLEQIRATKIVIAHRLSTVRKCDRIIVMEGGRIIEEGNFDSLMEKKGFFYELAQRQM